MEERKSITRSFRRMKKQKLMDSQRKQNKRMKENLVSEEVCVERHKNVCEKIEGIRSDLKDKEDRTRKIEARNITFREIQKNHEAKIQNHEERIEELEARPMKFWDKLLWPVIGALTSGIINVIIQSFAK